MIFFMHLKRKTNPRQPSGDTQKAILETLQVNSHPLTTVQICESIKRIPNNVRTVLHRLRRAGWIDRNDSGEWKSNIGHGRSRRHDCTQHIENIIVMP